MSILIETSIGDLVIDLFCEECPLAAKNFIKLCKVKYYNNCLFFSVEKDYLAITGDPNNKGDDGTSIYGTLGGERFFKDEIRSSLKFNHKGLVAMANVGPNMNASQFCLTLTDNHLEYLDKRHTIFGRVAEGLEILDKLNNVFVDKTLRPLQNVRIKHAYVLDDPFEDPNGLVEPDRSPEPVRNQGDEGYLEDDVDISELIENKTEAEIQEMKKEHEAKSRAIVLEMLEDLPDADITPPKNVLFVCKLNPVTQEHELELIFSRFGPIKSCQIIRDWKTGDSLQYAFIEFEKEDDCIQALLKMDGVLIDERRIHVDFSQSVAKLWADYRRKQLKDAAQRLFEKEDTQISEDQKWRIRKNPGHEWRNKNWMVFHEKEHTDRGRERSRERHKKRDSRDTKKSKKSYKRSRSRERKHKNK